jgi:hypothetical protein
MTINAASAPAKLLSVRQTLRLFWEADQYPILCNEDARDSLALEREAIAVAAYAMPSPDDPPEFRQWLDALCRPHLTNDERGDILFAMAAWFEVTP